MSIAISIAVKETGSRILRAVSQAIQPASLGPIIGRSATNTIREHLFGLNQSRPNAFGGRRTNYYATAARATQFQMEGDSVVVSINQIGMALRYFGGTIKPVRAKYLAIPARAEAHGKRPGEFNDLEVLRRGDGKGEPFALARAWSTKLKRKKDGGFSSGGQSGGEILFWLKKSVTQKADPSVLPYDELVETRATKDVLSYINRQIERTGGTTS